MKVEIYTLCTTKAYSFPDTIKIETQAAIKHKPLIFCRKSSQNAKIFNKTW